MVSKRMARHARAMANASVQTGIDAAITIAARTQSMMSPIDEPIGKAIEAQRMVQEKVDAALEGAFAAQSAWGAFMIRAAFGGVRTANDISMGFAHIAEAAAAPARRKVRANARRLTGLKALS